MPANSTPILRSGRVAAVAIPAYAPVKSNGSPALAGEEIIGFAEAACAAGQRVSLVVSGSAEAWAGAAIADGQRLQVGPNNTVVPMTTGALIGRALSAAAAGDKVEVLLAGIYPAVSGVTTDATRYKAQRLAHKADAAKAATTQARVWTSGMTVQPWEMVRLSTGQLLIATAPTGASATTGATEPTITAGAAPAAITDNGVTWWPLQELTRPAPAGVPVPVVTDNAGGSARTQYGINANPSLFEQASAPNVFVIAGSGNTARTIAWTINDGSSADFGAGAGRITPYRTLAFVVPDDVIDIGYFATSTSFINQRPIIEVDGYPAMEVPLVPAAAGSSRHLKLTIPGGRRERLIRIRCSGGFNLQYIATASDIAPARPPVRALTAVVPSDSFGNTEMPNTSEDHLNLSVRVSRRLGFPNCVMAVAGGTSYSLDDAGSGRHSLKKIMAAHDFSAFGADLFMPMHGYNAGGNGVAPAVECADALTCWQGMRAASPTAPVIPVNVHYLRPGLLSAMTAMRDALKAQFLAWADPNSAFIDPTDGSITLGDGTIVREASDAWINATNAAWVLPPSGGAFDGAHLSIAGRAYYEDKLVAAAELALSALGR